MAEPPPICGSVVSPCSLSLPRRLPCCIRCQSPARAGKLAVRKERWTSISLHLKRRRRVSKRFRQKIIDPALRYDLHSKLSNIPIDSLTRISNAFKSMSHGTYQVKSMLSRSLTMDVMRTIEIAVTMNPPRNTTQMPAFRSKEIVFSAASFVIGRKSTQISKRMFKPAVKGQQK